jgi:hypothetical protein
MTFCIPYQMLLTSFIRKHMYSYISENNFGPFNQRIVPTDYKGRSQMIIRCIHIACWIRKATNAYTDCVILNAFPMQQWSHECTSMLRDTHNECLVFCIFVAFVKWLGPTWSNYNLSCLRKWRKSLKQLAFRLEPPKSKKCQLLNSQSLSIKSTDSGDASTNL